MSDTEELTEHKLLLKELAVLRDDLYGDDKNLVRRAIKRIEKLEKCLSLLGRTAIMMAE